MGGQLDPPEVAAVKAERGVIQVLAPARSDDLLLMATRALAADERPRADRGLATNCRLSSKPLLRKEQKLSFQSKPSFERNRCPPPRTEMAM